MEVSGEVADLLVKEGLEAAKIAAELSGKGIVNMVALLAALAQRNYKVLGKVDIKRITKENVQSTITPILESDLPRFEKIAKQFGVLYAAVKSEDTENGIAHIVSNVNYAPQLNAVMEAMGYPIPKVKQEEQSAKKAPSRVPQEKSSDERGNGLKQPQRDMTPEKPSTKVRLAEYEEKLKEQTAQRPTRKIERTRSH